MTGLVVEPTELADAFELGGAAFYDEVPLTAVWMTYAEPLMLADYGQGEPSEEFMWAD